MFDCYLRYVHDCVLQLDRQESKQSRQESFFRRDLSRTDTTGATKQTASGRVELGITKHFSVVMDEDLLTDIQLQQPMSQDVKTPG